MKKTKKKIDKLESTMSRRTVLKTAVVGAAAAAFGFPSIVRSADDLKIVVRDPGGPFTPGFAAAFYKPFKEATGITVVGVQGQHEPTGLIRAMVESKNYTWNMSHLSKASHQSLVNIGYLEPIAPNGAGKYLSQIPDGLRGKYIMGTDVYA